MPRPHTKPRLAFIPHNPFHTEICGEARIVCSISLSPGEASYAWADRSGYEYVRTWTDERGHDWLLFYGIMRGVCPFPKKGGDIIEDHTSRVC